MDQQDLIIDAARRWVIRLASGEMGPAERQQFAAWLQADERHRRAFEAESQLWKLSGSLASGLLGGRMNAAGPEMIAFPQPGADRAQLSPPRSRRWIGAVAAAAAVAWIAALFLPDLLVMMEADIRTAAGQQRRIELPDGSVAHLNTASALALAYSGAERRVRLLQGEAFFEVSARVDLPFRVETGQGVAEAVGTAFGVRSVDGALTVTIAEGRVAVNVPVADGQAGRASTLPTLKAGQALMADGTAKPASVLAVDPEKSLAWRAGKIVFERTSFAEAIAELDRYFPGRILALADMAALSPVTGIVHTGDVVAGIRAIAAVEGLTVTEAPAGLLLILH